MFYCEVMEHEAGWGSKPDGYLVALSAEALDAKKAQLTRGESYELFYRFSPSRPCLISEALTARFASANTECLWVDNNIPITVQTVVG